MNDKSVDGSWGHMVDAIRWAVTIWPIVFAAVTAQAFKTWAAYRTSSQTFAIREPFPSPFPVAASISTKRQLLTLLYI